MTPPQGYQKYFHLTLRVALPPNIYILRTPLVGNSILQISYVALLYLFPMRARPPPVGVRRSSGGDGSEAT